MNDEVNEEQFYWKKPTEYRSYYNMRILGYADLAVCMITLMSNTFVIAIFTKKHPMTTGNIIFIHLAVMESLTTIISFPRVYHEYIRVTECAIAQHRTFVWEMISLLTYKIAFMFRHIAVWFAVMMTVWRYIAVVHPLYEREWCNWRITRKFIVAGYIFGFLLTIPPFFAWNIGPADKLLDEDGCIITKDINRTNTTTIYEFQIPIENDPVLVIITTTFYSGIKILPSVAFAIMSCRLIVTLCAAKKRRQSMTSEVVNLKKQQQTDRTTIILMIILALFIIAEVPHGIHLVLFAYRGPKFFWNYYYYAQEILNFLIQVSQSFNFVIYYAMSQQFRKNFRELFNRSNKNPTSNTTSTRKFISSSSNTDNPGTNSNQSSKNMTAMELQSGKNHSANTFESDAFINQVQPQIHTFENSTAAFYKF